MQPKARLRPGVLRKKLCLAGLVAVYFLAKGGITAQWNATTEEDWAYELYESGLQTLHSDKTEKLFL